MANNDTTFFVNFDVGGQGRTEKDPGALPAEDTEKRRQYDINEKLRKDIEKAQEGIKYNSFKIDEGYKLVFEKLRLANLGKDFRKGSSPPDMNRKLWKATKRAEVVRGKQITMDPKLYGGLIGGHTGIASHMTSDTLSKQEKKAKKKLTSARKTYENALVSGDDTRIREAEAHLMTLDGLEPQVLADAKNKAEDKAKDAISSKAKKKEKKEAKKAELSELKAGLKSFKDQVQYRKKLTNTKVAEIQKEIKKEEKKREREQKKAEKKQLKQMEKAFEGFTWEKGFPKLDKKGKPTGLAGKASNIFTTMRTMSQRMKTRGSWFMAAALMSPERTAGKVALNVLARAGPHGALLAGAITTAISTPEVIKAILKVFARKGGPLNRDWRRLIEDETTGILSLEEQERRDLGLDGYIVSPDVGFKPVDDSSVYNSQILRDEVRLAKLSQGEKVNTSR